MSNRYYIYSLERRIERIENEAYAAKMRAVQVLSVALMIAGALLASCSLAGLVAIAVR